MANVLTRIVYMTMNVLPEHEAKIINGVRHIAMGALEHLGQQRRIEIGPVELPSDLPFQSQHTLFLPLNVRIHKR
ncbi:hypothetical protein ACH5RR_025457 [Cinchona calisaya]|uniref:Uncharacterized protein n=1 Tax=Cinchona calisaya TaxID=153742 RepID=A0ABD2Z330_9GENT